MALGTIPPWLNIQPQNFLEAIRSGSAAGLQAGEARNRAQAQADEAAARMAALQQRMDEAELDRARRSWEFNQTIRQRAAETEAERERTAASLEESRRYHDLAIAERMAGHETTARHYELLAQQRQAPQIVRGPNGEINLVWKTGALQQVKPPNPTAVKGMITPGQAMNIVTDMGRAMQYEDQFGAPSLSNLVNYARSGVPMVPGATNTGGALPPPPRVTSPAQIEQLRREARSAIDVQHRDAVLVRRRFREMTGQEL